MQGFRWIIGIASIILNLKQFTTAQIYKKGEEKNWSFNYPSEDAKCQFSQICLKLNIKPNAYQKEGMNTLPLMVFNAQICETNILRRDREVDFLTN